MTFVHRFDFRENLILIEWRNLNSVIYIWNVYYVVVDFVRGNFAEKVDFKRFWDNDFLSDDAIVKDLNIFDDNLSNDMIGVVLTRWMNGW